MTTYRNYRTLTAGEIEELARLYPVTPNRLLARQYGISVDALTDYVARPRGWQKDQKAIQICSRGGRTLTEKETQWIIRHYQHTKNTDIMEKYGIGESSLHRLARKYGLKKSKQFLGKVQAEAVVAAHDVCRQYGVYEETSRRMKVKMAEMSARGERIPGSFMPGVTNVQRLGKKRDRERIEKSRQSRNETIRRDRLRLHWGLPQQTRIHLTFNGYDENHHKKSVHRHLFRKHNYIVDWGSDDVYYDSETDRHPKMEANAHKYGLRVMEA